MSKQDREIERLQEIAIERGEDIRSLQSKLATALEALEWYADSRRWQDTHWDKPTLYHLKGDGIFYLDKTTDLLICEAGERAREALAVIKGDSK